MLPLKIAVLWHQHQPYYKMEDEFILPWVRLHGVKDYFDLPEILHEFPTIKQTFNLVPSMIIQLEEYISGQTKDRIQRLTEIPAKELSISQKKEILKLFFICNQERMIKPYPRFWELFEAAKDTEEALNDFQESDWIDLQVWYNLSWFGQYSRKHPAASQLFEKGKNFTEGEKLKVLELQIEVLGNILPQMKRLVDLGQAEVAVSPMYHPILPLLCSSSSAAEAIPGIELPEIKFRYRQDAKAQIDDAVRFYADRFAKKPAGMWPSEGAISDEVLELIAKSGIKWVATDEEILAQSRGGNYSPTEKYFPRKYKSASGDISILFRDHFLSDRIGFEYSSWNHIDAANDFMQHLRNIRNNIVTSHGEEALMSAVVPIVLDGENCWEFYYDNGVPFLRELYRQLSELSDIETITCSEANVKNNSDIFEPITHIMAGSWINADFRIWIGHKDHRKAWTMLSKARRAVENAKPKLPGKQYKEAMRNIYIAEGSDWFWWYGDQHEAPNKQDFDILFRWYLRQAYKSIGMGPPEETNYIIGSNSYSERLRTQGGSISPVVSGKHGDASQWQNARVYCPRGRMAAMHKASDGKIGKVLFGSNSGDVFIRIEFDKKMSNGDSIEIFFSVPRNFSIFISSGGMRIRNMDGFSSGIVFGFDETMEVKLGREIFSDAKESITGKLYPVYFHIKGIFGGELFMYPNEGEIEVRRQ